MLREHEVQCDDIEEVIEIRDESPYQCTICGKIFGKKSELLEHDKRHKDVNKEECLRTLDYNFIVTHFIFLFIQSSHICNG